MGQETKVLILEDDRLVASSLHDLLSLAGCEVTGIAATVDDAVSLCEKSKPDVALVDIRLAGPRGGIEGAELLRQQFGLAVIFLTGDSDKAIARRVSGIGPCLVKPAGGEQLVKAIRGATTAQHQPRSATGLPKGKVEIANR